MAQNGKRKDESSDVREFISRRGECRKRLSVILAPGGESVDGQRTLQTTLAIRQGQNDGERAVATIGASCNGAGFVGGSLDRRGRRDR
jgi:hypothetical protein